jgi:lipopolysaccharide/colanic/teichoic acid biosynthesis glycosyltransferase
MKRFFDIVFSALMLLGLLPLFICISLFISLDSRGGIFYSQKRIGKFGKPFMLYKFRTMFVDSEKMGLLTIGGRDNRITRAGYSLRKFKLDELPQLINVLIGDMSLVGPRPEVEKYVLLYNDEQMKVLNVRPGLTDPASLYYIDESELLASSDNPEKTYIDVIMPAKLKLSSEYVETRSFKSDFLIIFATFRKIIGI